MAIVRETPFGDGRKITTRKFMRSLSNEALEQFKDSAIFAGDALAEISRRRRKAEKKNKTA